MKVDGKVIVVTGAGSGIGRALTLELLQRGAQVAAVDVDGERLQALAEQARAGGRLSQHIVDVAERAQVEGLPGAVRAHHGATDGLINNAGVIHQFKTLNELDYDAIERVIRINLWGPIHMLKAFLPDLLKRPQAHVANVSSMGGFMPFPGQTVYGASKAAVKLLTEGLYAELLDSQVKVSVVMPGAVDTEIAVRAGISVPRPTGGLATKLSLSPAAAARKIIDGIEADQLHITVGVDSKLMYVSNRLAPKLATNLLQSQMKPFLLRMGLQSN